MVHEINTAIQVLEGKSTAVPPKIAIYMLVHFVGDLHQPLHVGTGYFDLLRSLPPGARRGSGSSPLIARRTQAKGGNDLSFGNQPFEELHAYWDTALPEKIAGSKDPAALAKVLAPTIQPAAWADTGDHHAWAEAWATGSLAAARRAYAPIKFGAAELANGHLRKIHITLPANYDDTAVPLARERLAEAGFHLAELLNAIDWPAQN